MTSASTYTYEIDLATMLGGVTRADARKKGVQEFLSTDPLARKNAHQSPYVFADNTPIAKVDYKGGDGIIYLVALDGVEDAELVRVRAQEIIDELGLNYKVQIFNSEAEGAFDPQFLDRTDAYAVLGKNSGQVVEYLDKIDAPQTGDVHGYGLEPGESSKVVVEVASFNSLLIDDKKANIFGEKLGGDPSLVETKAFLLIHSFAHKALDYKHGGSLDIGILREGNNLIGKDIGTLVKDPDNSILVGKMNEFMKDFSEREGTEFNCVECRTPTDNYGENKANNKRYDPSKN